MKKPREFCVVEHKPAHHLSLEHYRCWLRPEGSHEADVTIITIEKSAYTDLQARAEKLKDEVADLLCDLLCELQALNWPIKNDGEADRKIDQLIEKCDEALKEWKEGEL